MTPYEIFHQKLGKAANRSELTEIGQGYEKWAIFTTKKK